MASSDLHLFIEVTTRQAEEAFRRRMEESNGRVEKHLTASRVVNTDSQPQIFTRPRELWWSNRERYTGAAGRRHSDKEGNQ